MPEAFSHRGISTKHFAWRQVTVVALVVGAVVLWLHGRSLEAFLYLDDFCSLRNVVALTPDCFMRELLLLQTGFRPVSMLVYKVARAHFGLNSTGYHAIILLLHIANVVQAYLLAFLVTRSRFVALATATVCVYQFVTMDALWNFGAIFTPLAALFYWQSMAWYVMSRVGGVRYRVFSAISFLFALGSKPSAITLPIMLTVYEWLWQRPIRRQSRNWLRMTIASQWLYYLLAGIFFVQQFLFSSEIRTGAYTFVITHNVWLSNMKFYLRGWFCDIWPWPWLVAAGILLSVVAWQGRDRVLAFGGLYVMVAFIPVAFLPYHQHPFFWYLPQLGMGLLTGQLLRRVRIALAARLSMRYRWFLRAVSMLMIASLLVVAVMAPGRRRLDVERWYITRGNEYRSFIAQLRHLHPTLPHWSVVAFRRAPPLIDSEHLTCLLQVMYNDLTVRGIVNWDARAAVGDQIERSIFFRDYQDGFVIEAAP